MSPSLALITSVLVASVLGSLHCAGMCGAFVAMAVGLDENSVRDKARLQALYNAGRLITYTMLGVTAGLIGGALDAGGGLIGVQHAALRLAGASVILIGVLSLLRIHKQVRLRWRVPKPVRWAFERGHRVASTLSPGRRAFAIGLLTTLLPCGWLYAFAIVAAGTASPLLGGATMAAFWLGTLPMMISIGTGVQAISGAVGRRLPTVMATLIIVVGFVAVLGRSPLPMASGIASGERVTTETLTERVAHLTPASVECHDEGAGPVDDGS